MWIEIFLIYLKLFSAFLVCTGAKRNDVLPLKSKSSYVRSVIGTDGVKICFEPKNPELEPYIKNPPKTIPAEYADRIYSISAGMHMTQPVAAFICRDDDTNTTIDTNHPFYSSERKKRSLYFKLSSVSAERGNDEYNGELCRFSYDNINLPAETIYDPIRLDPHALKLFCGEQSRPGIPTSLPYIKIRDMAMISQGLMHTKPSDKLRRFKFELFETVTSVRPVAAGYSDAFLIDPPVVGLRWVDTTFTNIVANHPFNISLEIYGEDGKAFTTGFGSTLLVAVTLSYTHKIFYKTGPKAGFLYSSEAILSGKGVRTSKMNDDVILQKRAVGGRVHFPDITILETTDGKTVQFQLNATLLMPVGVCRRIPHDFSDLKCIKDLKMNQINTKIVNQTNRTYIEGDMSVYEQDKNIFYTYDETCEVTSRAVILSKPFSVEGQKAERFVLLQNYGDVKRFAYAANFVIEGISFEVRDWLGRKIYTGEDSHLKIIVWTKPENVTIHVFNDYLVEGSGVFRGSVTQVIEEVQLCFTVVTVTDRQLNKECTITLNITGFINLAVFGHMKNTGPTAHPDPLSVTFARFAVDDINNQLGENILKGSIPVLPDNRRLIITSYNTKLDLITTTAKYRRMMYNGKIKPWKNVVAIIAFMSDALTDEMYPLIRRDKIICFGIREKTTPEVSEQTSDEYFVRLAFSGEDLLKAVCRLLISRGWSNIVLMSSEMSGYSSNFFNVIRRCGVYISEDIYFFTAPDDDWSQYLRVIRRVKNAGTKIILCFLQAPILYSVLRGAIELEVSPQHGYQWIFMLRPAMEMLGSHNHPICRQKGVPTCEEAFAGSLLIFTSNQINYKSVLWQHIQQKLFSMDRALFKGFPGVYPNYFASQFARGYDAVMMFSHGISKIIHSGKTITVKEVMDNMFAHQFIGLTGFFKHVNKRREDFAAILVSMRAGPFRNNTRFIKGQICRHLSFIVFQKKTILVEVLQQSQIELWEDGKHELGIMTLPVTKKMQKHRFYSRVGIMSRSSQTLILPTDDKKINKQYPIVEVFGLTEKFTKNDLLKNPNTLVIREEYVIMSHYCVKGCGGKLVSEDDQNNYTNGICVRQGKCRCKTVKEVNPEVPQIYWKNFAYRGATCTQPQCSKCIKGLCIGPETCHCIQGYSGVYCDEPICKGGCGIGKCVLPNVCRCERGSSGKNCGTLLLVLLGPLACSFILFGCCLIAMFHQWRKKMEWRVLMTTTDWLVNWSDVTSCETKYSSSSTSPSTGRSIITMDVKSFGTYGTFASDVQNKVVMWHCKKCYIQVLNCEPMNITEPKIRLEIVYLTQIVHPNIAYFLGISMSAPTVGLFMDFYPKGSLKNILRARIFPLDWDVKFSMLKDIARGMAYLHSTFIRSHGQLNSSCCLMDNRWAIRISGFGVPSIRKTAIVEDSKKYLDLLWTAPELLRVHDSLPNVIPGTKMGDVYSFAIIISEMCTEELPYEFERNYLKPEEIIMLLKNCNDPANRTFRTIWLTYNGSQSDTIRPTIPKHKMPSDVCEMGCLTQLMLTCWHENPSVRLTFKEVMPQLDKVKPMTGELVDLLVNRLERYSVQLESQIDEASRDLLKERVGLEEVLSRFLPKEIVAYMINGTNVTAEEFKEVTICFSDIVDFVLITKTMTPHEGISLLNSLYICFDDIIDTFDVYKVASVRDEYMIVSGLPIPNDNKHATEIALVALNFMSAMMDFETRYADLKSMLMLRIGIHTGPCIAGVVGLQTPHYCIFGDTIRVAKRMKESSSALKIQVSESTANILRFIGGFEIVARGMQDIKAHGKVRTKTYWLTGANGFDKPLPIPKLEIPFQAGN